MAALSVDLLLGYTGLITFGQAALSARRLRRRDADGAGRDRRVAGMAAGQF